MGRNEKKQSVLTFYSIPYESIIAMKYDNIFNDFILSKKPDISCRNIFSFELGTETLNEIIISKSNAEIFSLIKKEFEEDNANYMFIKPIEGMPVNGFYIKEYLTTK